MAPRFGCSFVYSSNTQIAAPSDCRPWNAPAKARQEPCPFRSVGPFNHRKPGALQDGYGYAPRHISRPIRFYRDRVKPADGSRFGLTPAARRRLTTHLTPTLGQAVRTIPPPTGWPLAPAHFLPPRGPFPVARPGSADSPPLRSNHAPRPQLRPARREQLHGDHHRRNQKHHRPHHPHERPGRHLIV